MDNLEEKREKQREKLKKVLNYLKEQGHSQAEIANNTGYDETKISQLKKGKIKEIPNEFLIDLHKKYNINPQYIRLESYIMLDILGIKLVNFKEFVNSWDTVEKNNPDSSMPDKYVHFTMDRKFYDLLLDLDNARLYEISGGSPADEEIEKLKQLFSGEPQLEEFVLLPKNVMYEIVEATKSERKKFEEVINMNEYLSYNNEE